MRQDPAALFAEVAREQPRCFWLDGGGSREWSGRRSLLGWLENGDVSLTYDAARGEVWRHTGAATVLVGSDIFETLEAERSRDDGDPSVSWVGYFGYACRRDLPALLTSSPEDATAVGPRVPDAVWMRVRNPFVFEHPVSAAGEGSGASSRARSSRGGQTHPRTGDIHAGGPGGVPEEYRSAFEEVQRQLRLGNSYEVNLTLRRSVESEADPVTAYLRLRDINPAPYAGFVQHHGVQVLSSSPERFATIDRRRWVETKPIKGTTPRGATAEDDERHRLLLASEPRFRSENLMIVDLLRNDLSMVCEPGTVTVPALMQVESYASVHQLVSTIRGRLRDDVGTIEALRAIFPAGSMTGAPKLRTMEIIADVESTPRGVYAGALGWISGDGRADLGVVIRTLVATGGQGPRWTYELGTGGGITVRSDVESEYEETVWKAARLLSALGRG
jgi:para-aminobenzoate synthetase